VDEGPPPALTGSVIIPTRNRPRELAACLDALLPLPDGVELIIGDDCDGPETRDLLAQKYPAARRVPGPKDGPGANRNRCAAQAAGRLLIFVDDDCLPGPGLAAAYLAAHAAEPSAYLAGPTFRRDAHAASLLWEAPEYDGSPHALPPSCNFAIPRAVFLAHGAFDERLKISYEDIDLFARLNRGGVPFHFVAEAAVDHPSRPLPPPGKLARRWEARVICAYDYGASTPHILWHLPRHVFLVLLSRLRRQPFHPENPRVIARYAAEFLATLWLLPGWIARYRTAPRSPFWTAEVAAGRAPYRGGF